MTYTIIDKSLDKFSKDFSIRHDTNKWYVLATAICIIPGLLALLIPGMKENSILYNLLITLLAFGVTSLLCIIAYFFLGDSHKAYFKPGHDWMERCELYFDARNLDKVKDFLTRGDFQALANMPRNHSQQYLVIMYKAPKSNVLCAQIAKVAESRFLPETEIFMFKDSEHNLPKESTLLDFFYKDNE